MVLACWQTPAAIRHAGVDRITALLRRGHVKNAIQVAEAMAAAARQQTVTLPGQRAASTANINPARPRHPEQTRGS
ncbi:hypothetical protein Vqi01_57530 [Micromonospora qiuiae]|uniref:Transposase n=2 Tax=Micromonospora qiuiae TaxID=502268 RepID=A0ABQ4JJH8_9ACTN|nr:hypothetical protein Vqi01_57530 [Micromonospora qiuiae]